VDENFDVLIAGGGPVGSALALAFTSNPLRFALLAGRSFESSNDDVRSIALSHGSRLILERLGVWSALAQAATAILHITVSQRSGYGRATLSAEEANVPALGYVVAYSALQRALAAELAARGVNVIAGSLHERLAANGEHVTVSIDNSEHRLAARLLAIADGGHRFETRESRTHDYRQCAVACNVLSERPHQNRAYERFTNNGPIALLPYGEGWSLIWTTRTALAQQLAALEDDAFCRALEQNCGPSMGRFRAPGPRSLFPLSLRVASRATAARTVLVGNAAQTLHPVAGQGYNLGLRDAWELARNILRHYADDPGCVNALNAYFSQRRFDRTATILFTDTLIRLFCNDIPLLGPARSPSLAALDVIAPAKKFFVRRMMFGARG
jgi:2-octaprenyl-6-methoxyphenol hydroxylase